MKSFNIHLTYLLLCLAITAVCCFQIRKSEIEKRALKEDLIELSSIKYGILSVDNWKDNLSDIIARKIEEFDFNAEQKAKIRVKVSEFLTKTIVEFKERFYEEKSKTPWGIVQGGVASFIGAFKKMEDDVPVFTNEIMGFIDSEENQDQIKKIVLEKFAEYTNETFSNIDYHRHNEILDKYCFGDNEMTKAGIQAAMDRSLNRQMVYRYILFCIIGLVALSLLLFKSFTRAEYWTFLLICLCLLIAGLFLPMIEIDARIQRMSFTLLEQTIQFSDQVLYYRSKSILEVVRVLFKSPHWDIKGVGALVLAFSVLFPISKLIASLAYTFNPKLDKYAIMRFLVFRTGKWSMADVLVVAIFMAFIGFSGIVTDQLHVLDATKQNLQIVTTNNSRLQIGFFIFTSFVILSILLSYKLEYGETDDAIPKHHTRKRAAVKAG